MIVLDTNVLSEMMKPAEQRSSTVFAWFGRQSGDRLYTTTITVAEVLAGVAILPAGRRRTALQSVLHRVLELFSGRCLPFDMASAPFFADAVTVRRRAGKSIDPLDMLIGAIARANGMAVATRNLLDFADCGVRLIDPWGAAE
ncbi:MAG: type II toxin-antitoxin system VapC family toxin [Bauldia sp.]